MEREYYQLAEAAELLSANTGRHYSERDLIHFGGAGQLPVYLLARGFKVHDTVFFDDGTFFEAQSWHDLVRVSSECLRDIDHGVANVEVKIPNETEYSSDGAVDIGPMPLPWRINDSGQWYMVGYRTIELRRKNANYLPRKTILEAIENGTISSLGEKYPEPKPVLIDECVMVIHHFDFDKLSEILSGKSSRKQSDKKTSEKDSPVADGSIKDSDKEMYLRQIAMLALMLAEANKKFQRKTPKRGKLREYDLHEPNINAIAVDIETIISDYEDNGIPINKKGLSNTKVSDSIREGIDLIF